MDEQEPKGTLDPAPVVPTEEQTEPEKGTGSADKRSPESQAEQAGPSPDASPPPGEAGGNVTR